MTIALRVFLALVAALLLGNASHGQSFWIGQAAISAPVYDGIGSTRSVAPTGGLQTTLKQVMARSGHYARSDLTQIKIVSYNFILVSGAESAPGATATVTASIEYPEGTCTRITWGGANSVTVPDGGMSTSDYISKAIPNGSLYWIRQYFLSTAGSVSTSTYYNDPTHLGDAFNAGASGIADQTISCDAVTNTFDNLTYAPIAIVSPITARSVCILGDSIAAGVNGSTNNVSGDHGIVAPSIGPLFGYSNMSLSGERAENFVASHTNRAAILQYCSDVIVEYGVNDLAAPRTAAQLQGNLTTIYGLAAGKTVFQTTITPESGSSDGWTTVAGQTAAAWDGERVTFNTALRNGSFGPNGGMFDTEIVIESSLNSGKWKAVNLFPACSFWTQDGVHPENCALAEVQSSGAIDTSRIHLPYLLKRDVLPDAANDNSPMWLAEAA